MDSIVYKLSTLASNHQYLNFPLVDKIMLQRSLAIVTESKQTSYPIPISDKNQDESNDSEYSYIKITSNPPKVNDETMKNLLIMQFDLELDLKEFNLARLTISKLKDVISDYGEHPVALMNVIICKARLLYREYGDLTAVDEYIHQAGGLVIKSYNNHNALNTNGGDLKTFDDLYPLKKELIRLRIENDLNAKNANRQQVLNKKIELMWDLINNKIGDLESWLELSITYLNLGQFKESLWCINELLGFESSYWDGWSLRGEICYLIGTKIKNVDKNNWLITSLDCHLRSIELNDEEVRSWCGAFITLKKIQSSASASSVKLNESHEEIFNIVKLKLDEFIESNSKLSIDSIDQIKWVLKNFT